MSDMKICAKCGAENAPNARFCTTCGNPFQAASPAVTVDGDETQIVAGRDDTRLVNNTNVAGHAVGIPNEPNRQPIPPKAKPVTPQQRQPQPVAGQTGGGGAKTALIIILAIIAVGGIAAATYFALQDKRSHYDSDDEDTDRVEAEASKAETPATEAVVEAAPETSAAPEVAPAETEYSQEYIKWCKNFSSHDLTLCDLHGHVSYARLYEDGGLLESYDFNGDGSFSSVSSTHNSGAVSRDSNGRVVSEVLSGNNYVSYGWSRGLISDVYHPYDGHKHYNYDSKGQLSSVTTTDGGVTTTDTYGDYVYDPFLNWTSRTRYSNSGTPYYQRREIVYLDYR